MPFIHLLFLKIFSPSPTCLCPAQCLLSFNVQPRYHHLQKRFLHLSSDLGDHKVFFLGKFHKYHSDFHHHTQQLQKFHFINVRLCYFSVNLLESQDQVCFLLIHQHHNRQSINVHWFNEWMSHGSNDLRGKWLSHNYLDTCIQGSWL